MQQFDENTLQKRIRILSEGCLRDKNPAGPVVYWMNRDQRAKNHWGLLYAQKKAEIYQTTFVVVFCLVDDAQGLKADHLHFMLQGLKETSLALAEKNIPFHLIHQSPEKVMPEICQQWKVPLLVTDFNPLRRKRTWDNKISETIHCPFHQVDSHNIVPCWEASSKKEYAAYTLRPKIQKKLSRFITPYPDVMPQKRISEWEGDLRWTEDLLQQQAKNPWHPTAGTKAGERQVEQFLKKTVYQYATQSNDPMAQQVSRLSAYMNVGQLSPQQVAMETYQSVVSSEARDSFLEQLIIRRELSDNYCYFEPDYDQPTAFPPWAKKTLAEHEGDQRDYLYSIEDLENCKTHDLLWNAAQKEMIITGSLHGYLRMYWAKKILEWSPSAAVAQQTAIYLNDAYLLDGRDPNGYAGIAWSVGGIHDRAWAERLVFGKVRYMNENGCRRKFDVNGYIDYAGHLATEGKTLHEPF